MPKPRKIELQKNWIYISLLALVILFYWFFLRPSQIRSSCAEDVVGKLKNETEERTTEQWQKRYDLYYKTCLHKAGLE